MVTQPHSYSQGNTWCLGRTSCIYMSHIVLVVHSQRSCNTDVLDSGISTPFHDCDALACFFCQLQSERLSSIAPLHPLYQLGVPIDTASMYSALPHTLRWGQTSSLSP